MPDQNDDLRALVREEIEASRKRQTEQLTEVMRDIETRLLTAFHGYGRGQTAREHAQDTQIRALNIVQDDDRLRLAALESRVLELEARLGLGQPPQA